MAEISSEQFNRAMVFLLRHVQGAPKAHFGDSRERTGAIRGKVHRLTDQDLDRDMKIYRVLSAHEGHMILVDRQSKTDLYDVAHELRSELAARRKG
jgi:hypothetical protein